MTYSGVRPLYDDGALGGLCGNAGLHAKGGSSAGTGAEYLWWKITTYRRLVETAMDKSNRRFQGGMSWTAGVVLPGGIFRLMGLRI